MLAPLLTSLLSFAPIQEPVDQGELKVGEVAQHRIETDTGHVWSIEAQEGARVEGRLLQVNGDVMLQIRDEAGKVLRKFDFSSENAEPFRFRAPESGTYQLKILPARYFFRALDYELYLGVNEQPAEGVAAQVDQWIRTASPTEPAVAAWVHEEGRDLVFHLRGISLNDPSRAMRDDELVPFGWFSSSLARIAVSHLVATGRLSLDTPLAEAANMPHYDRRATVGHLLQGQDGLRDLERLERLRMGLDDFPQNLSPSQFASLAEVQRESRHVPGENVDQGRPTTAVRTAFLQRVCETVTGEAYDSWATRELFQAWGMEDSFFRGSDAEDTIHHELSWENGAWQPSGKVNFRGNPTPMMSLRDITRVMELVYGDDPAATLWRESFRMPVGHFYSHHGSIDMRRETRDDADLPTVIYFNLSYEEGGPDWKELEAAVNGQAWLNRHPGEAWGRGGRGRRTPRPLPQLPVRDDVAGIYFASEARLKVALVRNARGHLELVHPELEDRIPFYQQDETHEERDPRLHLISQWELIKTIELVVNEKDEVIGFRATGGRIYGLWFERESS